MIMACLTFVMSLALLFEMINDDFLAQAHLHPQFSLIHPSYYLTFATMNFAR